MIEDMEDKGILDKARMEGMNQGIWLAESGSGPLRGGWRGASPRRAMDAGRRGTGVFLWIDRG